MSNKFLRTFIPIWYKVSASIESLFLLKYKEESMNILKEAKNFIINTRQLEEWYSKRDFRYISDKIDLSSLPWVVVHRLGGDCDDFMSLSYEILKSKYEECYRILVYSKNKSGHAILVVKENDNTFTLMSNMERIKGFKTVEEAAKYTYKEKTKNIIYLK